MKQAEHAREVQRLIDERRRMYEEQRAREEAEIAAQAAEEVGAVCQRPSLACKFLAPVLTQLNACTISNCQSAVACCAHMQFQE